MSKIPRLSEAIRIGAKLRPQAFRQWFSSANGGSCAVAAACEAIGIAKYPEIRFLGPTPTEWAWTRSCPTRCPECRQLEAELSGMMIHLNNEHRWTREEIADWVDAIERLPSLQFIGRWKSARPANQRTTPHG